MSGRACSVGGTYHGRGTRDAGRDRVAPRFPAAPGLGGWNGTGIPPRPRARAPEPGCPASPVGWRATRRVGTGRRTQGAVMRRINSFLAVTLDGKAGGPNGG